MSRTILIRAVLLFSLLAAGMSAVALDAGGDSLYFANLFSTYVSEEETAAALDQASDDREVRLKAAVFYWMNVVRDLDNIRKNKPMLDKALAIAEKLWKADRKDNRATMVLADIYMSECASVDLSRLDEVLGYLNKAQSLLNILVARLPENMDARMGRTQINMNFTAQTGRPDAVILDDAAVFLRGFQKLPPAEKENAYFRMGVAQVKLAVVMVKLDQGKRAEAARIFAEIERDVIPSHLADAYLSCAKRVGGRS